MNAPSVRESIWREYRWNFTVNILDGACFWFGMSFFSSTVVLPLFVRRFTISPLLIGLVPLVTTSGHLLPQLFVANATERSPRKKFFPVTLGLFLERVPVFLMVPATYFLATNRPMMALTVFFVLYAWFRSGSGLIVVGWQDMIAKIIPVDRRGRFFGITYFIGNGAGILGAAALPGLLRGDRNFRRYLLSQMVFVLGGMATGFFVVHTEKRWSLPDVRASEPAIALQIGLAAANLLLGLLSDRTGHKVTLEIGYLAAVLSSLLALLAPTAEGFFPILFLQGTVSAVSSISGVSIVYELAPTENRPTYIGLSNTVAGLSAGIAPLIGGWLAGSLSYRALFIVSALTGIGGWALLHFAVRDPRGGTPRSAESTTPPLSKRTGRSEARSLDNNSARVRTTKKGARTVARPKNAHGRATLQSAALPPHPPVGERANRQIGVEDHRENQVREKDNPVAAEPLSGKEAGQEGHDPHRDEGGRREQHEGRIERDEGHREYARRKVEHEVAVGEAGGGVVGEKPADVPPDLLPCNLREGLEGRGHDEGRSIEERAHTP